MSTRKVQRELAFPVAGQRVRTTGLQVGYASDCLQVAQSRTQPSGAIRTETARRLPFLLAKLSQSRVPEADFHEARTLIEFT